MRHSVSLAPKHTIISPPLRALTPPQGVAYESPYDGNPLVPPGHQILAVANTLPYVVGPNPTEPACAAFGGATVGSVTMFDTATLQSGYNDNAVPFQASEVVGINKFVNIINHKLAGTTFPD